MISANDLRRVQLTQTENGYSVDEVNAILNQAAETIDAFEGENKELYHKMEVLAGKIEEYREEEDSIKTALITAQKMADKIKRESNEEAEQLLINSKATAKDTVDAANEKAEKIISEARSFSSQLVSEKTAEAEALVADAEKKANDAINSSKIVAQNILDQAKEISEDLIGKSKEENEAYKLLNVSLKNDAAKFIENLKALYSEQLESLNGAKLETDGAESEKQEIDSIHSEVNSLVSEIDEMEEAIPESITIADEEPADEEAEDEAIDEAEVEDADDVEEVEEVNEEPVEDVIDEPFEGEFKLDEEEIIPEEEEPEAAEEIADDEEEGFTILDEGEDDFDDEPADPMEAVEAFSQNEITPIDTSRRYVPEIEEEPQMEEKSLFDEEQPAFESYFNVNKNDAHLDKTQTISLVPPEDFDDGEDDEPKFRGFFKKKR